MEVDDLTGEIVTKHVRVALNLEGMEF